MTLAPEVATNTVSAISALPSDQRLAQDLRLQHLIPMLVALGICPPGTQVPQGAYERWLTIIEKALLSDVPDEVLKQYVHDVDFNWRFSTTFRVTIELVRRLKQLGFDFAGPFQAHTNWPILRVRISDREAIALASAYGADINFKDEYGKTVLHDWAESEIDEDIMETIATLVSAGARLDIQDNLGFTALHFALRSRVTPNNALRLVELAAAQGADVKRLTNAGQSIFDVAVTRPNRLECMQRLVIMGFSPDASNAHASYREAFAAWCRIWKLPAAEGLDRPEIGIE